MLKKLLKHELKNTFKFLGIFYSIGLIFSLITRFIFELEHNFLINLIGYLSIGIVIAMMFSILIYNVTRIWVKFRSDIYGDESYLTHTLPVKKSEIYLSKMITSIITLAVSICVIILMLFIVYYTKDNVLFFKYLINTMLGQFSNNYSIITVSCILIFLELLTMIIVGITGIILGHKKNNQRTLYSVVFGMISYGVVQTIILSLLILSTFINPDLSLLFEITEFTTTLEQDLLIEFLYIGIIIYSVIFILNNLLNIKLLNTGVNVD